MSGFARAESGPYTLSAYQSITYQPNVFQAGNGGDRTGDIISGTGIDFGFSTRVDATRLFANGNLQGNLYQETTSLNNASFGLNLGATSTGDRLSSTIRYAASQQLGNYGTPGVAATTDKNLQTNQDAGLALRYRLSPRSNLVGGLGYQSVRYSAAAFDSQETSSGVGSVDVTHKFAPDFTGGLGLRYSAGVTPYYAPGTTPGSFISDRFDGQYVDFLASWKAGVSNNVNARISLTRTSHTQASQLDFSGLTWFIGWSYVPNSRLSATATFTQNTGSGPSVLGSLLTASPSSGSGTDTTGAGGSSGGDNGSGSGGGEGLGGGAPSGNAGGSAGSPVSTTLDNNRLNTSIGFAASYQLSRTLSLTGSLLFNNAGLVNSNDVSGNAWSSSLGLGLTYAPTRSISLGCALSTIIQNASQSAETSGQAYSYRSPTVACTGTIAFL